MSHLFYPCETSLTMSILADISPDTFLSEYWQQKPRLIRNASQAYSDLLSADELAGMACEEQVESRLIIEQPEGRWRLENGPFPEQRFAELPECRWTLLVQSVDQWLPDVGAILEEFDFLPSWRLDDVMISYAAKGGSVGPHFDYYDVFLLQTAGKRHWQLGQQCDQNTALQQGTELKLLEDAQFSEEYVLEPGDMLYIPAGLAHWGTALDDDCMTWSIGFRAPSAKELLSGAMETLVDQLPDHLRYRDTGESLQCNNAEFGASVHQELQRLKNSLSETQILDAMADVLGCMSTEPRYPELFDHHDWSVDAVTELLDSQRASGYRCKLGYHDACRLAFRKDQGDPGVSVLYANGEQYRVATELAEALCQRETEVKRFHNEQGVSLLTELFRADICWLLTQQ